MKKTAELSNLSYGEVSFNAYNSETTQIGILGMELNNFNEQSIDGIRELLTKYGMEEELVFLSNYYDYWLVDRSAIGTAKELTETRGIFFCDDEEELKEISRLTIHQFYLNSESEFVFESKDETIPPEFMRDLVLVLAEIDEAPINLYVSFVTRKGFTVVTDEIESKWLECEDLLRF